MYLSKKPLILVLWLLLSITLYAQQGYHTVWYSADSNHLPQNSVKSIIKDKYGYIWISTESGLVRYDGQNFRLYNSDNMKDVSSDRMFIFGGSVKNDSIYIRNTNYEYFLIRNRSVKRYKPRHYYAEEHPFIDVMAMYHNALPGQAFRIETDKYIYIIKDYVIKQYNHSSKLLNTLNYKYKDSTHFFGISNGLYHLKDDGGYRRFTGKSMAEGTFGIKILPDVKIWTNMPARQTFLLNGNKLYTVAEKEGKPALTLIYDDFDRKINLHTIYYDAPANTLYLGSANKGLLVVRKHEFGHMQSPFRHATGTDGVYYALTPYEGTNLLASTGAIFKNGRYVNKISLGSNTDKYCLVIDDAGNIWTKTHEKLFCYKKAGGFKKYTGWPLKGRIAFLYYAEDKHIWIGSSNGDRGYLYRIDPRNEAGSPELYMNLDFDPVCFTSLGSNIFMAGSRNGLYKIYLRQKKAIKINTFPDAYIRSIYIDSANNLWAASYNKGLFLFANNKTTAFPPDKNRYLLTSHCIMQDSNGFFWVTTNRGLFRIKKQDLLEYASGKKDAVYYFHFDKSNGFLNNEFNGGCQPCGVYLNRETIYFPSMDGIISFKPGDVKINAPANKIYIDDIYIDGKAAAEDSLYPDRNFSRIDINVSSPYSGSPYNQHLEVGLKGPVSQPWMPLAGNTISFTTLPPGKYTVTIRKLSGFGSIWVYKSVDFTVVPAFWERGWFIGLLILLCTGAIYAGVRIRIRYIRYKNIMLEKKIVLQTAQLRNTVTTLRKTQDDLSRQVENHKKLVKLISHDIKSPLRFMAITGKYLYNSFEEKDSTLKDDILAIHSSSSQLYEFVDQYLEYAKETGQEAAEPYILYDLINEKTEFFKTIAHYKKTTFENLVPKDLKITVNRHLLSIILHNLADNALKNTVAGTISFTAWHNNEALKVVIKDTGRGMAPEQVARYMDMVRNKSYGSQNITGMGLPIIIELMHIMGGCLQIESVQGRGTTFTLSFSKECYSL